MNSHLLHPPLHVLGDDPLVHLELHYKTADPETDEGLGQEHRDTEKTTNNLEQGKIECVVICVDEALYHFVKNSWQ